ncbi:MAG: glycine zipper 2TM domain-containing protein, partial [Salinisphaeraceae bacterium]|nr:glycine zipper 2TM domain-containing protein [Salinisphaeraceae bacterium]
MKKMIVAASLMAAIATPNAFAGDSDKIAGGALGAAIGAIVGSEISGKNGAILGGAIGAAAGVSIADDRDK